MFVSEAPPRPVAPPGSRLLVPFGAAPPLRARAAAAAPSLPQDNLLLKALNSEDWQRWQPLLERVEMPLGEVLCESRRGCSHVVFPTTAIVSLMNMTCNGACTEVATVGNDGVIGLPLLMGSISSNGRAVVQCAGQGFRLPTQAVADEFNRGGAVLHLLLRYSQALLTQVAQTAVCNRHHSVDQQLCRLILLCLDRLPGHSLKLTHEQLGGKLGVRRESVTVAALALQRDGLIRYARGSIDVLDRKGLEHRACECYAAVKQECDRLLPPAPVSAIPELDSPQCAVHCA